jgi:hypothetical protein
MEQGRMDKGDGNPIKLAFVKKAEAGISGAHRVAAKNRQPLLPTGNQRSSLTD